MVAKILVGPSADVPGSDSVGEEALARLKARLHEFLEVINLHHIFCNVSLFFIAMKDMCLGSIYPCMRCDMCLYHVTIISYAIIGGFPT